MADYADWSVPQANANSIAATGVPLLGNPNALFQLTPVIGPGATFATGLLPISQLGYEISLFPFTSGSGAASPLEIQVQWFDASGVYTIEQESWWIWPGNVGTDHFLYGKGPTKGALLQVSLTNHSSAMAYTVPIQMWQRSHPYTRDDWRSRNYTASASGNPPAPSEPTATVLGYRSINLPANTADVTELPLYSGPCFVWFQTQSGTTDCTLTVESSADPSTPAPGTKIIQLKSGANGIFYGEIVLPRYQCRVSINNGAAVVGTCVWSLYTLEQAA
jgi:hypothetical protein